MKFLLPLIFFASTLFSSEIELHSEYILLMNMDTRRVLYEKNADVVTAPASVTKIGTALFALKEVGEDLDVSIVADQDCVGSITEEMQKTMNYNHPPYWQIIGGTHMSIARGDKNTLEHLLYGLMLASANDAANVIAKYVSGSIPQFVSDLNDYLEEIGCKNTHFRNPHGLCFPKHYTTARDLAIMTCEAYKYPLFRKIVSTEKKGSLRNLNALLHRNSYLYYPYATGVKTGNHSLAGKNLVATAEKDGRTLLLILMGAKNDGEQYQDAKKLFDNAFSEKLTSEVYLKEGEQKFRYQVEGIKKPLRTYLDEPIHLSYYPSEKPQVKGTIHWHPPALPIEKGDVVAELILKDEEGVALKEVPLLAFQNIAAPKKFAKLKTILLFGLLIGLTLSFLRIFKKAK